MTELVTMFGIVVSAVIGPWLIAKLNAKTSRDSDVTSAQTRFMETLLARVASLEAADRERRQEIAQLQGELSLMQRFTSAALGFIDSVGWWIQGGMRGQRPMPPTVLHDRIDLTPWRDHGVDQVKEN